MKKRERERRRRDQVEAVFVTGHGPTLILLGANRYGNIDEEMLLTPITAFSSVMVTCLARSTALATCC